MEIEWREPQKLEANAGKGKNQGYMKQFVEELKKRPGKWAVYKSLPAERRNALAGSMSYMKRRYGLEAITRTEGKKVYLYARWPKPSRK